MTFLAIPVLIHDRTDRAIDGMLLPIDAESRNLSIKVREVSPLLERVVGETNSRNNVASCKSSLLGLREIFIDVAVEFELFNVPDRHAFLRSDFGRIEDVEIKVTFLRFLESLDAEFPCWEHSLADSFVEVFRVETWILAGQLQRLIPHKGVNTKIWCEMEAHKVSLAFGVGEGVRIDTEPLHHSVGPRNAPI